MAGTDQSINSPHPVLFIVAESKSIYLPSCISREDLSRCPYTHTHCLQTLFFLGGGGWPPTSSMCPQYSHVQKSSWNLVLRNKASEGIRVSKKGLQCGPTRELFCCTADRLGDCGRLAFSKSNSYMSFAFPGPAQCAGMETF